MQVVLEWFHGFVISSVFLAQVKCQNCEIFVYNNAKRISANKILSKFVFQLAEINNALMATSCWSYTWLTFKNVRCVVTYFLILKKNTILIKPSRDYKIISF